MSAIQYTAFFIALHGLLFIGLSCYISWLRVSHKVSIGDQGDRVLMRAMRAHGNFSEHVPMALILMGGYAFLGGNAILIAGTGSALFISRAVHAWGLLDKATTVRRQIGAGVTYLAELVFAIGIFIQLF